MGGRLAEFCAPDAQCLGFVAEVADAVGEYVGGEGAGFEGVHVALDRGVGLGEFAFGGCELVLLLAGALDGCLLVGGEGAGDELGVAVEIDEGGEDGVFEGVGAEAFGAAGVFAVALRRPARVVAVAVSFAVGGDADVVAVAARAGDEPGEEVLGVGVGETAVVAFAALVEQGLGIVEQDGVKEGFVGLMDDVAEGDLAEVAAVSDDAEDHFGAPAPAGAGA